MPLWRDTGYASMGRPSRVRQVARKGITFSASICARMEILFLISVLVFVAIMPPTGNGSTLPTGVGSASSISTRSAFPLTKS